MKVKNLIIALQKYPYDMEVFVDNGENKVTGLATQDEYAWIYSEDAGREQQVPTGRKILVLS